MVTEKIYTSAEIIRIYTTKTAVKDKVYVDEFGTNYTGQSDGNLRIVSFVGNDPITPATKTKVTYDKKGLITKGEDATTADISDSIDKRYVTDANLVTIGSQSGINTGDETTATIIFKIGYTPANVAVLNAHTGDSTIHFTEASISHLNILNIGTNTHAQIDTAITNSVNHIASTSNPHAVTLAQVGGTLDHNALNNLTVGDVHTQYALLAGRSGGQTLIGGTGTTDDLIFQTTSGIGTTGADIVFKVGNVGGTEAMRILNSGFVGIGTNNPTDILEVAAANAHIKLNAITGTSTPFHLLQRAGVNQWAFGQGVANVDAHFSFYSYVGAAVALRIHTNTRVTVGAAIATPGSQFVVNGNCTIGGSYIENTAETNGLNVQGRIGAGTLSADAQLHARQLSITGAIPVLTLEQLDVDEDYIKIIGTSDTSVDRALVDAANFTTPGAIKGWLKINVQDNQATNPIVNGDYYVPFYAAPTA